MKKITPKLSFKDDRGSIETIFIGKSWREINKFTSEKGAIRGNHYHKETEEMIFILQGKVKIKIKNVKTNKIEKIILKENEGILIEPFEQHTVEIMEKTVWLGCLTKEYDNESPDVYKG